jgi:hypothetical protein
MWRRRRSQPPTPGNHLLALERAEIEVGDRIAAKIQPRAA